MSIDELSNSELGFIEIVRAFNFLFQEGYRGKQFSTGGREPYVCFENRVANREISIVWAEGGYLDIRIKRKRFFGRFKDREFSIRDCLKYLNREKIRNPVLGTFNILKTHANIVQQHLMPVIKGEMWIDEIERNNLPTTNLTIKPLKKIE